MADIAVNENMSSVSLINRVKYSKVLFRIYFHVGTFIVKMLKFFLKTDYKLIVFSSFGGRKFDDSPKAIYEEMLNDHRFDDFTLVWAFINPRAHEIPRGLKIKTDTYLYYRTLIKARVWVTNSSMTRGLSFKGNNTLVLNTWHGSAIKRLGIDKLHSAFGYNGGSKEKPSEIRLAQSKYDVEVFSRAHGIPKENFRIIGLPRNDELIKGNSPEHISEIKRKMGLVYDKKIILYAPTFREFERDKNNNCTLEPPLNLKKWETVLGDEYILLYRAHYEVARTLNFSNSDFVYDVSSYENISELMLVSDVLISDYSSVFFDYSILGRPMFVFAYDFEIYNKYRGLYFDIRKELNDFTSTEAQLIDNLKNLHYDERCTISKAFSKKYVESYGTASAKAVDIIYQTM